MKSNYKALYELVERIDERNSDGSVTDLLGVSIDKCFIKSVANTNGTDLTKYKVIRKDDFAVSLMQVSRDSKIPVARLDEYDKAIMSPAYPIFRVKDKKVILPEYLDMWFKRPEFDREAAFIAVGGVRGSMPWEEFEKMQLPVPPIEEQLEIVASYKAITDRIALKRRINDNLFATTQAIYKSWFVDFEPFDGICPRNWLNGCVDDIAEFYDSMRKPLSSLERADMERIYPYYGAVSIVDYVDDFIFDGEYLLVSEDGIYVVDENGHPLLQHITGKFWANNHAHILKGKAGFNEDSLYLFLENTNMAPIVTGAAQPKINQANLKSFPITIPTSDVIEKFNALIQPFFDQRLSNEAQVKKLENLKDLLLSRLVN